MSGELRQLIDDEAEWAEIGNEVEEILEKYTEVLTHSEYAALLRDLTAYVVGKR